METLVLVLLLLLSVLISSVIDQMVSKVSSPLIQICLGVFISIFFTRAIDITFDPELFLVLFIAPLLYNEAAMSDKAALWRNKVPVFSLALGLVVASTFGIGFFVHWLIPSIPLPAAFALGAALGPTDAVAVASLPKEVRIGERERSILRGESLINDASGIVSFQFAIAACVYGTFSIIDATVTFAITFFGGILFGIAAGFIIDLTAKKVRSMGLENTTFHVLLDVLTPLMIYLAAEPIGVSGILAVVAAGIVISMRSRSQGPQISRMNIVSSSVWRVFTFALNGIVFVLLGTQLPRAMESTWDNVSIANGVLIGYVLLIALAVVLIRFIWILGVEYACLRKDCVGEKLGRDCIRSAIIMTFGGAKGTVTLSIIFTIPVTISAGVLFPQRPLITFLACGVILCTLLLANFGIPLLAPKAKEERFKEKSAKDNVSEEVTLEILRNVIARLASQKTIASRRATRSVIHSYNERIARIKDHHDLENSFDAGLRLQANEWHREILLILMEREEIHPLVGYKILKRLEQTDELLKKGAKRFALYKVWENIRIRFLVYLNKIRDVVPGLSPAEERLAIRATQRSCIKYVTQQLRGLAERGDVPAEDVSAVILEYQRMLASMRDTAPLKEIDQLASPDRRIHSGDIRRLALSYELEEIQSMYEDGRLTRAAAQKLRENVYLMQLDLEDKV